MNPIGLPAAGQRAILSESHTFAIIATLLSSAWFFTLLVKGFIAGFIASGTIPIWYGLHLFAAFVVIDLCVIRWGRM